MNQFVGIDFGTTNSALAVATPDGQVQVAQFSFLGQTQETFRSVLYFSETEKDKQSQPLVFSGPRALEKYLEEEGAGRLLLSPKNSLSSPLFDTTRVHQQTYRLEDLVSLLLRALREHAEKQFGPLGNKVVAGRPVHFFNATEESRERLALTRLKAAFHKAGFDDVQFEMEPVAAARSYEARLTASELVLIADFGGGTTDFCLMEVGPIAKTRPSSERIRGVHGVGIAGDRFDGKIVQTLVAPAFGIHDKIRSEFGKLLPMPVWPYTYLSQWYTVGRLREPRNLNLLYSLCSQALQPEKVELFLSFVEDNLGFPLYRSVEETKIALSSREETIFSFCELESDVVAEFKRAHFSSLIQPELTSIAECCDQLLLDTGLRYEEVDRVFLTGGSSFVPAVRALFLERFGEAKLGSQEEFTSVAKGLALRAREVFGGAER